MSGLTYSVISSEDYPDLLKENGISVSVHFKLLEHAKCHFCNVVLKHPMQTQEFWVSEAWLFFYVMPNVWNILKSFPSIKRNYTLIRRHIYFFFPFTSPKHTHSHTHVQDRFVQSEGAARSARGPELLASVIEADFQLPVLIGLCWQFDLWHFKLENCFCFTGVGVGE